MLSITLFLIVLAIVLYFFTRKQLEAEMGKRLIAIASITANDLTPWLLLQIQPKSEQTRTYKNIRNKLLKAVNTGQVSRAYVVDLEDHIIADSDVSGRIGTPAFEHQLYRSEMVKVRNGISIHTTYFEGKDGRHYKSGFVPIYLDSKVIAILGVEASADFFKNLRTVKGYFIYAIFFVSLLIVVVSILIAQKIVHPIETLVDASKRIGTGDLETPITQTYTNEFGMLATSIDEMRQDLLEKDSRMKTMLQGIAHEIRNPLGGIELFAGLLAEGISKKNKEQHQEVKKIQEEVLNLKTIVEQFLDFARDLAPQLQWVKAESLVEDVIYSVQLMAEENSVQLSCHVEDDALTLYIDERLMKRVLINMIRNAIQAIKHKQGRVDIGLRRVAYQEQEGVQIEVRDNGSGIAPEELPNLFRPFFTTKEKGCGLGLAFCHKIVHAHRGHIRVDSAPNKGTLMAIWIPQPNTDKDS